MPAGPVVLNNTPLVALWQLERLGLLHDLFGQVFLPLAVHHEFISTERELRRVAVASADWIEVVPLAQPQQALAYEGLGRGEAEVLALAIERSARLVIIDELRGRRYARRLGLPLTGTLGVLLLAKERGLVDRVAPLVSRLQEAGLYLHPALVARALEMGGEA
jgi:predicted nucleic acid-binding protein